MHFSVCNILHSFKRAQKCVEMKISRFFRPSLLVCLKYYTVIIENIAQKYHGICGNSQYQCKIMSYLWQFVIFSNKISNAVVGYMVEYGLLLIPKQKVGRYLLYWVLGTQENLSLKKGNNEKKVIGTQWSLFSVVLK